MIIINRLPTKLISNFSDNNNIMHYKPKLQKTYITHLTTYMFQFNNNVFIFRV